jgi:hypothetical protein
MPQIPLCPLSGYGCIDSRSRGTGCSDRAHASLARSCGGANVVLLGCVLGPGMKLQGRDAPSRALGCWERQCVTGGSSAREAIP